MRFRSQRSWFSGFRRSSRLTRFTPLLGEQLECRQLLTSTDADYETVSPRWFQKAESSGAENILAVLRRHFDLDDIRAPVSKLLYASRTGADPRQVDNA